MTKKCTACHVEYEDIKNNFDNRTASKDGFISRCKKCKKNDNTKYANTENGYLTNTFHTIKKRISHQRYKHLVENEKLQYKCHVTKQEFFDLWEEHKKKYGYNCLLTNTEMICKRSEDSTLTRFNGYQNGMSVDRLDPLKGYTKENIIFITNKVNKDKSAITKELCEAILKVYKEKGL
jgi:hypothetical protein